MSGNRESGAPEPAEPEPAEPEPQSTIGRRCIRFRLAISALLNEEDSPAVDPSPVSTLSGNTAGRDANEHPYSRDGPFPRPSRSGDPASRLEDPGLPSPLNVSVHVNGPVFVGGSSDHYPPAPYERPNDGPTNMLQSGPSATSLAPRDGNHMDQRVYFPGPSHSLSPARDHQRQHDQHRGYPEGIGRRDRSLSPETGRPVPSRQEPPRQLAPFAPGNGHPTDQRHYRERYWDEQHRLGHPYYGRSQDHDAEQRRHHTPTPYLGVPPRSPLSSPLSRRPRRPPHAPRPRYVVPAILRLAERVSPPSVNQSGGHLQRQPTPYDGPPPPRLRPPRAPRPPYAIPVPQPAAARVSLPPANGTGHQQQSGRSHPPPPPTPSKPHHKTPHHPHGASVPATNLPARTTRAHRPPPVPAPTKSSSTDEQKGKKRQSSANGQKKTRKSYPQDMCTCPRELPTTEQMRHYTVCKKCGRPRYTSGDVDLAGPDRSRNQPPAPVPAHGHGERVQSEDEREGWCACPHNNRTPLPEEQLCLTVCLNCGLRAHVVVNAYKVADPEGET